MTTLVFVSHATRDQKVATRIVDILEAEGMACFYAPRDLQIGMRWHERLLAAIEACQLLVLVLSAHASKSDHVLREVDIAVGANKPVLPIRIDASATGSALDYLLRPFQFLNASRRLKADELRSLIEGAKQLLYQQPQPAARPESKHDDGSLFRQLLLARTEHELALLSEKVDARLELTPQDIELRMLRRQLQSSQRDGHARDSAPRRSWPAGAFPVAFVTFFGFALAVLIPETRDGALPDVPVPTSIPPQNSLPASAPAVDVARERAAREKAEKDRIARDQAAKEQAAKDKAARERAARDQAARHQAARKAAAERTPADLYEQALALESSGQVGEATRLYRQAADGGNGPAMKRMWELLRNTPGAEREAHLWQLKAYSAKVAGVPEPPEPAALR